MDNISEVLSSVLSDPEQMERLRETARSLGLSDGGNSAHTEQTAPAGGLAPVIDRLAPLLGRLNEEDDMTRLLHALRPYLTGARLKRAGEAERIVSVMRILPLLRQQSQSE